jgi:hypothetical protein
LTPATTHEQVASKVTARVRQGRRFWNMTVRFRAPVAITDATSAYNIRISKQGTGRASIGVTHQNITRGELVTQRFQHLNGGGTYRIKVSYHRATEPGQWDPSGVGGVTVGRFRLRVP